MYILARYVVRSFNSAQCFQRIVLPTSTENGVGQLISKTIVKFRHQSTLSENNGSNEFRLIYEGPLSKKVKLVKWFSFFTASASIIFAPSVIFLGKQSVPFAGKVIVGGTILTMGVSTTLLLHWLTKVYVHKLHFEPNSRMFAAETSNLFGITSRRTFHVGEVVIPEIESMFSTFEAQGRRYFLHTDLKEAEQMLKYIREYNYEQDIV